MLYASSRKFFDLKQYRKIENEVYKSLSKHNYEDVGSHYREVVRIADEIYLKKDRERMIKAVCRLNKIFAGKKIVAVDYVLCRYIGEDIYNDLKSANIFDYDFFIGDILNHSDTVSINELYVFPDYARIELIISYGSKISKKCFNIKEISSEQYDDFLSQNFSNPNDIMFYNRKVFNYCFEIYKQNKGITLRRAALGWAS